jgi:predicted DNA-binding transcriptional regulator AlpA
MVTNSGAAVSGNRVMREGPAAEYCGVSSRTLQRWRANGDGPPFVRLTGTIVGYRVADLDAFLSARTFASTSAETVAREAVQ